MTGKKWYWLWLWAFLVCYAQVYVGKHYPGDILAGAVFGMCTGILIFHLFSWLQGIIQKKQQETPIEKKPGTELS